jgi:hypothetical protein
VEDICYEGRREKYEYPQGVYCVCVFIAQIGRYCSTYFKFKVSLCVTPIQSSESESGFQCFQSNQEKLRTAAPRRSCPSPQ